MKKFSRLAKNLRASPTLAINNKVAKLKSEGVELISLGLGEPQEATSDKIQAAAIHAIMSGAGKYTSTSGLLELREEVASYYSKSRNLPCTKDNVVISAGAKNTIYGAFVATIDAGDEVIIPLPAWPSYQDIVSIIGGKPVLVKSGQDMLLSPDALEAAITDKTVWVCINSPSNPTGLCYSKDHFVALAKVLERYPHVSVLCDDIYEGLYYGDSPEDKFISFIEAAPHLRERIFIASGASKVFAMTGWRIGWGIGNEDLIAYISKIQGQSITCPSDISQRAVLAGLKNHGMDLLNKSFRARRDKMTSLLREKTPHLSFTLPKGAFYIYASCDYYIGKKTKKGDIIKTDDDLTIYLMDKARVACVSGTSFGFGPALRFSYTVSDEQMKTAVSRIADALNELE